MRADDSKGRAFTPMPTNSHAAFEGYVITRHREHFSSNRGLIIFGGNKDGGVSVLYHPFQTLNKRLPDAKYSIRPPAFDNYSKLILPVILLFEKQILNVFRLRQSFL